MEKSFIKLIENSIRKNWNNNALTDFNGPTIQYKGVARKIAKLHILFEEAGIRKGDKIAVCGRNSANWCVAYLATITYGAVIVPILHDFKADNIHNIVNHSEARILMVGNPVWENLNDESMGNLEGAVSLTDSSLLMCRNPRMCNAYEHLNEKFGQRFPNKFSPELLSYDEEQIDNLAIMNYTSGTTGFSKGVMLSYRCILSNVEQCIGKLGLKSGDNLASILPLGHVFGMTVDFLYGFSIGAHLWFLTRTPSPTIVAETFPKIKPKTIACVPLVLEKIIKKNILPRIDNKIGRLLLRMPIISDRIKELARKEAMSFFGGEFKQMVIGGAPLNPDVEAFLRTIGFPYTIGYGMTECGPLITLAGTDEIQYRSCGTAVVNMELKVDSDDPENHPGELLCRGANLMMGYYKNEEETAAVIDGDGWLHTGDIVTMDKTGNVYIKGRCKNMLLSASGQNIYPEEIEAKINNLPYVSESLVIMKQGKLVALVYPDYSMINNGEITNAEREALINKGLDEINALLPAYSQITKIIVWGEEFEKTAKKSIKRYLYQNIPL